MPIEARRLLDLPHDEAARLARSGAPLYLLVNPVEYHGPHLSLHNDRLISWGLTAALHERLRRHHPEWPLLVADDLEVGVDPCPGPGSRYTPFSVACAVVEEACRALVALDVRRVVLMTFHGSPLHNLVLARATRLLARHGVAALSPINLLLRRVLTFDAAAADVAAVLASVEPSRRDEIGAGLGHDFHAGFLETSLALALAPSSVDPRYATLPPCPKVPPARPLLVAARLARALGRAALADECAFAAAGAGWRALRPFPGYTGWPHLASATVG